MDTDVPDDPAAGRPARPVEQPSGSRPLELVGSRTVLIAGGTSVAGRAAARALREAEARVITVGRDAARLDALREELPGLHTRVCDLTDEQAVAALVTNIHDTLGPVDGLLHLVGGWRGGGGLAGQSDADYRVLEQSFTALRVISRAFDEDLRRSEAGRLAIVSSTAVAHPLAGGANYAAVKAASEAWVRAVDHGFVKDAHDAGRAQTAAAVVFRVTSLAGLEEALADAFVALWDEEAAEWNDVVLELLPAQE